MLPKAIVQNRPTTSANRTSATFSVGGKATTSPKTHASRGKSAQSRNKNRYDKYNEFFTNSYNLNKTQSK